MPQPVIIIKVAVENDHVAYCENDQTYTQRTNHRIAYYGSN